MKDYYHHQNQAVAKAAAITMRLWSEGQHREGLPATVRQLQDGRIIAPIKQFATRWVCGGILMNPSGAQHYIRGSLSDDGYWCSGAHGNDCPVVISPEIGTVLDFMARRPQSAGYVTYGLGAYGLAALLKQLPGRRDYFVDVSNDPLSHFDSTEIMIELEIPRENMFVKRQVAGQLLQEWRSKDSIPF